MSRLTEEQSPSPTSPEADGDRSGEGPRQATVIIEDLDTLEMRKLRGEADEETLAADRAARRRLFEFARPFRGKLLLAFGLSAFSAVSAAGALFLIEGILQPIVSQTGPATPLELAFTVTRMLELPIGAVPSWLDLIPTTILLVWTSLGAKAKLAAASVAFAVLALVDNSTKYAQKLTMRTVSLQLVAAMRVSLFGRLMGLSLRFFHANHSGKLLSRITHDLTTLGGMLVDVMVVVVTDAFAVVGALGYLWYRGGSSVILGLLFAVVAFFPVQRLAARVRRREHINRAKMGDMFTTLTESLSAQKVVKAFGAEDHEQQRFETINTAYTKGRMKSAALKARTGPLVEFIGGVGSALLMWFGGVRVIEGYWAPETFMALLFGLARVISAVRRMASTNTKLHGAMASADRVATVLYSEAEIRDEPDAVVAKPFADRIVFQGVSYAHEKGRPVLTDIDLEVKRGQTVALVGPTGAGKSTIGDLVARFYDVDVGSVSLDGTDVRRFTVDSLREQIAMVTQETVLFQDSVGANIAYGMKDVPAERIEAAAKAAHAHEFISRLEHGYDSIVGERGTKLSGGERQRVAIARALLKDAPVLILDEATSALDSESEALVQDALDKLKEGRTTLVIAHRLSTVRDADLIIVLENGRIVERGTHAELMRAEGLYAKLVRMQSS